MIEECEEQVHRQAGGDLEAKQFKAFDSFKFRL